MEVKDIKNNYAISKGFESWNHLFIIECYEPLNMEKHYDEIFKSIINKQK